MDKLKEYLRQRIDEMDTDILGDSVWSTISQRRIVNSTNGRLRKMIIRWSAAACLLVAVGYGIKWMLKKEDTGIARTDEIPVRADTVQVKSPVSPIIPENETVKTDPPVIQPKPKQKRSKLKRSLPADDHLMITELKKSYATLINLQLSHLRRTPVLAESPDYFSHFQTQLKEISTEEKTILDDVAVNGIDDKSLEQLIDVYQEKLNILKRLRAEVHKLNSRVKQSQQAGLPAKKYYLHI